MGFVTAGLVVAAGLAQVAAIRAQQYPGRRLGGPVTPGGGYIVGENGPEFFRPNSAGRIMNNNDTSPMGGVNVTFNINTIDATGFDDLLTRRQDLIVSLINQSLADRGKRRLTV